MNYLVDTNVLSKLAKPLPADGVLAWFHANQSHLYVSSVSMGKNLPKHATGDSIARNSDIDIEATKDGVTHFFNARTGTSSDNWTDARTSGWLEALAEQQGVATADPKTMKFLVSSPINDIILSKEAKEAMNGWAGAAVPPITGPDPWKAFFQQGPAFPQ
jgi:hypothetical protein